MGISRHFCLSRVNLTVGKSKEVKPSHCGSFVDYDDGSLRGVDAVDLGTSTFALEFRETVRWEGGLRIRELLPVYN